MHGIAASKQRLYRAGYSCTHKTETKLETAKKEAT